MAEDRSYLNVLFDHFPTRVLVADDRAFYVDVNQAACQLLDRTREQLAYGLFVTHGISPQAFDQVTKSGQK